MIIKTPYYYKDYGDNMINEISDKFCIGDKEYIVIHKYKALLSYNKSVNYDAIVECLGLYEHKYKKHNFFALNRFWGNTLCLILSNKCNLNCKYCYSAAGTVNRCDYMQKDRLITLIDSFFENHKLIKHFKSASKLKFLFHGGGEPTYNWNLFEFTVNYIKKKSEKINCEVILKLVTNGIFTSDKAKKIGNWFNEVIISIDGPDYINDYTRPMSNLNGATKIVENSINIISGLTTTGVHSVVTGLSSGKGREITRYFIDKFPDIKFIHYEKYRQTIKGNNMVSTITSDDFYSFLSDSISVGHDKIKSIFCDFKAKNNFCRSCDGEIIYCFPNGNITICNEHDCDEENAMYVIGNTDDLKMSCVRFNVINNDLQLHQKKLECQKCFAFMFCAGGCRSMYSQSNNFEKEWCYPLKLSVLQHYEQIISNGKIIDYNGIKVKYVVF